MDLKRPPAKKAIDTVMRMLGRPPGSDLRDVGHGPNEPRPPQPPPQEPVPADPPLHKGVQPSRIREEWDSMTNNNPTLVDVPPHEAEYWNVMERLRRDMPNAYLSRLWRVNNEYLRAYYNFHKQRFAMCGIPVDNQVDLWHGTGSVDPGEIYRDLQDGFMVQYASKGLLGPGLYFAQHSNFSDLYAYVPRPTDYADRPGGDADEREMFLATLLVGNAAVLDTNDVSLVAPHLDPARPGRRYTTVIGDSGGYPIYTVYENGRAYPSYLVRYYEGERNTQRTPYSTFDEARAAMESRSINRSHPTTSARHTGSKRDQEDPSPGGRHPVDEHYPGDNSEEPSDTHIRRL